MHRRPAHRVIVVIASSRPSSPSSSVPSRVCVPLQSRGQSAGCSPWQSSAAPSPRQACPTAVRIAGAGSPRARDDFSPSRHHFCIQISAACTCQPTHQPCKRRPMGLARLARGWVSVDGWSNQPASFSRRPSPLCFGVEYMMLIFAVCSDPLHTSIPLGKWHRRDGGKKRKEDEKKEKKKKAGHRPTS